MVKTLLRRGVLTGAAIFGLEAAYAVLRPSPDLPSYDPTGEFGDPADPLLKVAALGDSSIEAPGVDEPGQIWISIVCRRLAEQRHVVLQSFAVGGARAANVLADQVDDAIAFDPDLIFVSVGANDALKGVPLASFTKDLDHIVERLTGTEATVVQSGVGVLGIIPRLYPPLSTLMSWRAERFDGAHRQVAARYGTAVVDHRSDDVALWYADRSLWAADLFHVSPAGHARWSETTWRTVGPLMNGSSGSG
jgi:lysophospholipase L1-like esterase